MNDCFDHWDYPYDDPEWEQEDTPFHTSCKWCGGDITMTPTDDGWRPMQRGNLHVCEARKRQHAARLLSALPDLDEQPPCQFCKTVMEFKRYDGDYEVGWSFPHFQLVCPECGSCGPRIEIGDARYDDLNKRIKR